MQSETPQDQLAELLRELLAERPVRYGWKRSRLDQQQVEYIIQREAVIHAIRAVMLTDWQSIDLLNKELADKIRSNCLHALATLAQAMRANEDKIL